MKMQIEKPLLKSLTLMSSWESVVNSACRNMK